MTPMTTQQKAWWDFTRLARERSGGHVLLLAESGSRSYGTHRPDSDYDFRGVFVASPAQMLSLAGAPETLRLPDDGEVDGVCWELRHFCKLAANANPTVLEVLWADTYLLGSLGRMLRDNRDLFLSKRVRMTYGGYALAQVKKARAGSGGSRGVEHFKREKFKLHTLRLLHAGVHTMEHGEVMVRLNDPLVARLKAEAKLPMDEFEETVKALVRRLDDASEASDLPDEPDYVQIERLMRRMRGL